MIQIDKNQVFKKFYFKEKAREHFRLLRIFLSERENVWLKINLICCAPLNHEMIYPLTTYGMI